MHFRARAKSLSDPEGGKPASERVAGIDALRGIASMAVALFHFGILLETGLVHRIFSYGHLGVDVFFVVSGFVVPYSLASKSYTLRDYGRFILKRVIRLEPPYLVTLALILGLGTLPRILPYQPVAQFEFSWPQLLLHLGYLNAFFGYPWLVEVLWTLAVEFQYYLLLGLLFPLLVSRSEKVRWCTLGAFGLSGLLLPQPGLVFRYSPLFLFGIGAFLWRTGRTSRNEFPLVLVLAATLVSCSISLEAAAAGLFAVCAILWFRWGGSVLRFLGTVSYSLYLLHSPVGRRAQNLVGRVVGFHSPWAMAAGFVVALGASLLAAYVLYVAIERPAQRWSASIGYKRHRPENVPAPLAQG